jgi:hypothetical protein
MVAGEQQVELWIEREEILAIIANPPQPAASPQALPDS